MKVIDCSVFNGEYDLLEIRFNILNEFVDTFVIVEGIETFSGNPKPLYWVERPDGFEEWEDKVVFGVVGDYSDIEIRTQIDVRDYVDTLPFQRAFYQKESIRKILEKLDLDDEDIIYWGDIDEIWKPKHPIDDKTYKLRQLCYSYFLNNRSSEDWRGTIVTKWKNLKNGCLNDMRAKPEHFLEDGGWHFTNMGGLDMVLKKLGDYDHQEVNVQWVREGMADRIEANIDFLGRALDYQGKPFKFWVEEENLPQYLKDNKEKYQYLFKPSYSWR